MRTFDLSRVAHFEVLSSPLVVNLFEGLGESLEYLGSCLEYLSDYFECLLDRAFVGQLAKFVTSTAPFLSGFYCEVLAVVARYSARYSRYSRYSCEVLEVLEVLGEVLEVLGEVPGDFFLEFRQVTFFLISMSPGSNNIF